MLLTLDPELWTADQSQLNNELQKAESKAGEIGRLVYLTYL